MSVVGEVGVCTCVVAVDREKSRSREAPRER